MNEFIFAYKRQKYISVATRARPMPYKRYSGMFPPALHVSKKGGLVMAKRMRSLSQLLATLALGLGVVACAGQPVLPSGAYTSVISRNDVLSQDELSATARGIVAGYWEMRPLSCSSLSERGDLPGQSREPGWRKLGANEGHLVGKGNPASLRGRDYRGCAAGD